MRVVVLSKSYHTAILIGAVSNLATISSPNILRSVDHRATIDSTNVVAVHVIWQQSLVWSINVVSHQSSWWIEHLLVSLEQASLTLEKLTVNPQVEVVILIVILVEIFFNYFISGGFTKLILKLVKLLFLIAILRLILLHSGLYFFILMAIVNSKCPFKGEQVNTEKAVSSYYV